MFEDDIIFYLENPKDSKELSEPISTFSEVGYKTTQKSVVFLYANNSSEKLKKKNNPIYKQHLKKPLELTKPRRKDVYTEKLQTIVEKEIKGDK